MAEREYIGAIHLHSTFSDGRRPVEEIIAEARRAELDYIIVCDHNSDDTARRGLTGWHDGLLVLSAPEVGGRGCPHFLAFGLKDLDALVEKPSPEALEDAFAQGAANVIAHPHAAHIAFLPRKPVDWTYWDTAAFRGMEIWSYMHDVCHNAVPWRLPLVFTWHRLLVTGPRRETLELWDRLCRERRVAAFGSLDNHASRRAVIREMYPHRDLFRTIRTHVVCETLPEDGAAAIEQLTDALLEGKSFIAMDAWSPAAGFTFRVEGGATLGLGRETLWQPGMRLVVESPQPADLAVVRDGDIIERRPACRRLELPAERPGVYRIEGRLRRRPWVFTNPIYLREA
ncbi:MAG: PHP domain-containing protein [Planctomycetes bacterium]|nr:PHP domain-containing protein [Planctomycetota bacterium]